MEKHMFCFQCEQTAGCSACTGCAGVCGKQADTAVLQDRLTGALIGLARAAEGNEDRIHADTDRLVLTTKNDLVALVPVCRHDQRKFQQ